MDLNWPIIVFRFIVTFVLALLYGLERQRSHKPIGFGTFIFVSVGSCALAITATQINSENPLPLLSAIITGIGFLGAGALIKTTDKIFGFTTAASIWLFSIIGLVIGSGEYMIGGITYALVWIVIYIDRFLEKKGIGTYQKRVLLVATKNITTQEIEEILRTRRYKIVSIEIDRKASLYTINLLVEGTKESINQVPKRLFKTDWIQSFKIE